MKVYMSCFLKIRCYPRKEPGEECFNEKIAHEESYICNNVSVDWNFYLFHSRKLQKGTQPSISSVLALLNANKVPLSTPMPFSMYLIF